jgi:hypothetical protein
LPTGEARVESKLQGNTALIVLLLLGVTLNSGSAWAQKVILLCSGTFQTPGLDAAPTNETIVVDYGLRTVNGPLGSPYSFTSLDETKIEFSTSYLVPDNAPIIAVGKIDRVSGDATIMVREQNPPEPLWIVYALSCHPALPAF